MATHLTQKQIVDIITAYTVQLESAQAIATRYNRTRQSVYKLLKSHNIDPNDYAQLTVSCTACGAQIQRPRCHVRDRKHLFCGSGCHTAYQEAMNNGSYDQNRRGQRVARSVVSRYHQLQPGEIIHHIDGNTLNNHPTNLAVYANQGDHIRIHNWGPKGVEVPTVWTGSELNQ